MTPSKQRQTGSFFTGNDVSTYVAKIIQNIIQPDLILEPFVGAGSLIQPFSHEKITFVLNDINIEPLKSLQENNQNINKNSIHNVDFIATPNTEIVKKWIDLKSEKNIFLYTNPPFGTKSTNRLSMKKNTAGKSRNLTIDYHGLEKKYGKGDLILPALGKMIEIVKEIHSENQEIELYFGFYSPFGIFCERRKYNKLLKQILDNFKFLYGEIFSGDSFENVNKNKPISFSLWKFTQQTIPTNLEDISFIYNEKIYPFKRVPLLKQGWSYDNRKFIRGEIVVQGNDRFNAQVPKMLHMKIKKGGAELVPENVKKPINLRIGGKIIPDELVYGLWSITVGNRSIVQHPLYIDNNYTHLPDFTNTTTQEILAYSSVHALLTELKLNYTDGKIRIEDSKLVFGGKRLTNGAQNLLSEFSDLPLSGNTIGDVIHSIIKEPSCITTITSEVRPKIKVQIQKKLEEIHYWNILPLPLIKK